MQRQQGLEIRRLQMRTGEQGIAAQANKARHNASTKSSVHAAIAAYSHEDDDLQQDKVRELAGEAQPAEARGAFHCTQERETHKMAGVRADAYGPRGTPWTGTHRQTRQQGCNHKQHRHAALAVRAKSATQSRHQQTESAMADSLRSCLASGGSCESNEGRTLYSYFLHRSA
jgi:hypothetical protein